MWWPSSVPSTLCWERLTVRELGTGILDDCVSRELWISLASLLRSYCAAHGMNREHSAVVEADSDRIMARQGEDWLELRRTGAVVCWKRRDGASGTMEFTEAGQLRSGQDEEEMDMAAERWARKLMRESER